MATTDQVYSRPFTAVLSAVISATAYLIQSELGAARAAVGEKLGQLLNGGVSLAVATALALPGFFILFLAIVRWLTIAGLAGEWSLTLVGVVVLAISAALAVAGVRAWRAPLVLPDSAITEFREDLLFAREAAATLKQAVGELAADKLQAARSAAGKLAANVITSVGKAAERQAATAEAAAAAVHIAANKVKQTAQTAAGKIAHPKGEMVSGKAATDKNP
jgi:hypothetical protein